MAKKVLITGAAGFAGQYLVRHLLNHSTVAITATYHSPNSEIMLSSFTGNIVCRQVDITNKEVVERLIEEIRPDEVYHLAAQSSPADSFKDPEGTIVTNVLGQLHILEAIRKQGLDTKILITSSSEVYGAVSPDMLPLHEGSPCAPNNPYAVSKLTQDYLALQYFLAYEMKTIRVRPFNHTGPKQTERFVVARFAKEIAQIEKGKQEPIIEVGNLEAKRDFTDVRDVVAAYVLLLEKGKDGEVYNVGSGISYRIGDILEKLLSLASVSITVKENRNLFRPSDIPDLVCDYTKVHTQTGWKPNISLDTSLKNTLDYWREIV